MNSFEFSLQSASMLRAHVHSKSSIKLV